MKEALLPGSLKTIGDSAFFGCASLEIVFLPAKLSEVGSDVFYSCSSLVIYCAIEKGLPTGWDKNWNSSSCQVLWGMDRPGISGHFIYNLEGETATISDYRGYEAVIVVPEVVYDGEESYPVTKIGEGAFEDCDMIAITLPQTITRIEKKAFKNCSNLAEIQLPGALERINEEAFYNCRSLTEIIIPRSVIYVHSDAFYNCSKLIIYCQGDASGWAEDWNPSNRPYYENMSNPGQADGFIFNVAITSSSSFVSIVDYIGTEKEVVIPDTLPYQGTEFPVVEIGNRAFQSTNITSIDMPDTITRIGLEPLPPVIRLKKSTFLPMSRL